MDSESTPSSHSKWQWHEVVLRHVDNLKSAGQFAVARIRSQFNMASAPSDSEPPIGSRGQFIDTIEQLRSVPVLFDMFIKNDIEFDRATDTNDDDDDSATSDDAMMSAANDWNMQLQSRIAPDHLRYKDVFETQPTMNSSSGVPKSFVSSMKYNPDYTIQTFENVCLLFRDRHQQTGIVLIGPIAQNHKLINESMQATGGRTLGPPNWIPARYRGDGAPFGLEAMEAPMPHWRYLPGTTFHQTTWDFNLGHQFHMQIMPMQRAIVHSSNYHTPKIDNVIVDRGLRIGDYERKVRYTEKNQTAWLEFYQERWLNAHELLARTFLEQVSQQVTILRSSRDEGALRDDGICFDRLVINGEQDMYMDRQHPASHNAFADFKRNLMDVMQIKQETVDLTKRPLRITIYSRHDASRRRIENVPEIKAMLEPHHIVRHIKYFGTQPPVEQFAIFSQSDILIAPHGAHMTFAFMLPPGALVYETFAHTDGHFSWIPQFLRATQQKHIERIGIANMTLALTGKSDFRHMDRDYQINTTQLCIDFEQLQIAITCNV